MRILNTFIKCTWKVIEIILKIICIWNSNTFLNTYENFNSMDFVYFTQKFGANIVFI